MKELDQRDGNRLFLVKRASVFSRNCNYILVLQQQARVIFCCAPTFVSFDSGSTRASLKYYAPPFIFHLLQSQPLSFRTWSHTVPPSTFITNLILLFRSLNARPRSFPWKYKIAICAIIVLNPAIWCYIYAAYCSARRGKCRRSIVSTFHGLQYWKRTFKIQNIF